MLGLPRRPCLSGTPGGVNAAQRAFPAERPTSHPAADRPPSPPAFIARKPSGSSKRAAHSGPAFRRAEEDTRSKESLQVFYSIADPSNNTLCDLVCASIERRLSRQSDAFAPPPR